MLLIIILNSMNQTTKWKKYPVRLHLPDTCICLSSVILQTCSFVHPFINTLKLLPTLLSVFSHLWFKAKNKSLESLLSLNVWSKRLTPLQTSHLIGTSELQSDTGVHHANCCCKAILFPLSQTTAGNLEQASLEVVFAKCFKRIMWLWRVSLGQRGGCGAEVKCGSAKYLGLLETDMHWNSHTMFLHLLELII